MSSKKGKKKAPQKSKLEQMMANFKPRIEYSLSCVEVYKKQREKERAKNNAIIGIRKK